MEKENVFRVTATIMLLLVVTIAVIAYLSGQGKIRQDLAQDSSAHSINPPPSMAAAMAAPPISLAERRVGIVYSAASAENFYGEVEYNQLFASIQFHASQAGLSFDLLDESDIVSGLGLQNYSVLVFPHMSHVNRINRNAIVDSLVAARQAGVAMVVSADFLAADETGRYFSDGYSAMETVLGITAHKWRNQLPTKIQVSNSVHPISSAYTAGELLVDYSEFWFAEYIPVANQQTVSLLDLVTRDETFVGALAYELDSRIVHFSNPQVMADHEMLTAAIEWAAYGSRAPVSLLPSRFDNVFLARNDMDQAMYANDLFSTEIPLLQIITDWKERYNFVGSYYLDIGNNPLQGEYTDWAVSGPLYQSYLDLGSEIGTHSWTHPHFTSDLSATELEFEFNQSRQEISENLGINVIGGAVPGNPENMFVIENLNEWFEYFSGRTGGVGIGFPNAIGYLEPQHTMRYFSLNLSPDFTLVSYMGYSSAQAQQIWQQEYDDLTAHAKLPVLQWLWHDYGPTETIESGDYSYEMFDQTLNYAHANGSEFLTLAEYHHRLSTQNSSTIQIASDDQITVQITPATDAPPMQKG